MTERLTQLLHQEADTLDVPGAPVGSVLREAHRARTRRRAGLAGIAAATLAVAGAATAVAWPHEAADRGVGPASSSPLSDAPAFAIGATVFDGDASTTMRYTVHSLHYTSAGVLVRSNDQGGASDGSGPETLTLVRSDATTTDLGTVPEGVGPATDPTQPYYALARATDSGFEAVVRDVRTGDVVGRVPLPDLPPSYWDVPPLGLDGDTLYVGYKKETAAVDWHTGDSHVVDGLGGGIPDVHGGHAVVALDSRSSVVDVATGRTLLSESGGYFELSPDGRWAVLQAEESSSASFDVYDVAAGTHHAIDGQVWDFGWTPDGHLFAIKGSHVTTCDPATGDCSSEAFTRPPEPPASEQSDPSCSASGECVAQMQPGNSALKVTLGGRTYES